MTQSQIDALMDFLQLVMSIMVRHGRPEDQMRLMEQWQETFSIIKGDG